MKLPVADIIEWDVLNWSQLIRFWTPIVEQLPKNSNILAIGERNGGLTTWLSLLGHKVVCTDRNFPTEKAKADHCRLRLTEKITYASLDIVHANLPTNSFDLVIGKSVIGGLKADPSDRATRNFGVQRKAVDNVYALLKNGGYFLSAENMRGTQLMQRYRLHRHKERGWRYLGWEELPLLYEQFCLREVRSFGVLPTNFHSDTVNRACYWANRYILTTLPKEYKYISFVVAQKIIK
ncbi:class I SAM-dependent methyltransferase [Polluticoccus soli]|uniref:class I SAM-dependent methyltransferase n=1 Tax=Polluticoccus soli TaxID=3034150 RepID=UPI0023E30424|nr:methyltransferase domain-containing protein [Flavipsychrobacter sp. JY13-12]